MMHPEITAGTVQAVTSAKTRIEILVDSVRPSLPWTHFVSIPLNTSSFIQRFELFKSEVMEHASKTHVSDSRVRDTLKSNNCVFCVFIPILFYKLQHRRMFCMSNFT